MKRARQSNCIREVPHTETCSYYTLGFAVKIKVHRFHVCTISSQLKPEIPGPEIRGHPRERKKKRERKEKEKKGKGKKKERGKNEKKGGKRAVSKSPAETRG